MRWVGHVARTVKRDAYRLGKYEERDHAEDIRVDERMLLKWILQFFFIMMGQWRGWTELVCFRIENKLMSHHTILSIPLSPPCPAVPIFSSLPSSQTYPTL